MENNLEEAREFIKKGLEYLKQVQKEDGVFIHGRHTAEAIEITTGSPSYVCNGVKETIKIIRENLVQYYMAHDEHWMACPEYATTTQFDKFLKDFIDTVEKRIQ